MAIVEYYKESSRATERDIKCSDIHSPNYITDDFRWDPWRLSSVTEQIYDVIVIPILPSSVSMRESQIPSVKDQNVSLSTQGYAVPSASTISSKRLYDIRPKSLYIF